MANQVKVGWVWEAVPDEPKHFYEILSNDEVVKLRNICDNRQTTRFIGQITDYGITRKRKPSDKLIREKRKK